MSQAIVDTNIFVASGFNPESASRRVIDSLRSGQLALVWTRRTRAEVTRIIGKIPPLSDDWLDDVFDAEHEVAAELCEESFEYVEGSLDRHIAALANTTGAAIVSLDEDLHECARRGVLLVFTPGEFVDELGSVDVSSVDSTDASGSTSTEPA